MAKDQAVAGKPYKKKEGGKGGPIKKNASLGAQTKKRMQSKIQALKSSKQNKKDKDDEEILSDASGDVFDDAQKKDAFFDEATQPEQERETLEEKRLRITKKVINEYGQKSEAGEGNFFETLVSKTQQEMNVIGADDDQVTQRMKMHMLEQKGKLFYKLAADFCGNTEWEKEDEETKITNEHEVKVNRTFMKGHKQAITCLTWMPDNKSLITGSKDCNLIQWDLETQKKDFFRGVKYDRQHVKGHFDEVLACAVSPNGKYLISGGKDRMVRVWDIHNRKQIQTFLGHKDSITDICFDRDNDQFYTVSCDRSLKVWNLRELCYMDTHYGHHADILSVDSYGKDRLLSCGRDSQAIFWKIDEDAELMYTNMKHSTDVIKCLTSQFYMTCSASDNAIDLWIMNKKKPIYSLEGIHSGRDSWILSAAAVRNSDLFCTGSWNGQVVLCGFDREKKKFGVQGRISGLPGCLNAMAFSHHRNMDLLGQTSQQLMLAVTHSKEEKLGRWHVQKGAKNGVTVMSKA